MKIKTSPEIKGACFTYLNLQTIYCISRATLFRIESYGSILIDEIAFL